MKKRAFTLAETLITLAIIGIVASLIMPGLRNSMSRDTKALSLARTVELFHNGISEIFNEVHMNNTESSPATELVSIELKDLFNDDTDGYLIDGTNLMDKTMGLMGTEEVNDYDTSLIRDYSGNEVNDYILKNLKTYRFKKLNSVIMLQSTGGANIGLAPKDTGLCRVLIDVNGNKAPNRIGNDIFLFALANNGQLVPAGSDAYNNNIFMDNFETYQEACQDNIDTGLSCAARVMADGWKINY